MASHQLHLLAALLVVLGVCAALSAACRPPVDWEPACGTNGVSYRNKDYFFCMEEDPFVPGEPRAGIYLWAALKVVLSRRQSFRSVHCPLGCVQRTPRSI